MKKRKLTLTLIALYVTFIGGSFITDLRLWPRVFHHVFMTILLSLWLFRRLRRGRGLPAAPPIDLPLLTWLAVTVFATIFAVDPRLSLEAVWRALVHILFFYLILDIMRSYGARAVLEPLFFASGVVIVVGLIEFISWYFGLPMLPIFVQGWPAIGGWQQPIPPTIYRLSFTLGYPTALSAYLAMLIPFGLAWAFTARQAETRRAFALWLVGALTVEGLTFSRGGLVSLAVSLSLFALLTWREWIGGLFRGLLSDRRVWVVLAIAGGMVLLLGGGWARQNLAGHLSGDAVRADLWRSALDIARTDWLTGVGPDGFGRALRHVRDPMIGSDRLFTAHNRFLTVLAETGVVGAGVLVWGVVAMIGAAWQRLRGQVGTSRAQVAGAVAGIAGFTAHNLVDEFTSLPLLAPLMVMAAYVLWPHKSMAEQRWRWWAAIGALALMAVGLVGWGVSDLAQYYYVRSLRTQGDDALAAIDRARRLDSAMELYALQRAQFLGELALSDATRLDDALTAYAQALRLEETSDLAHANVAYLLMQSGDLEDAYVHMEQAAQIRPREAVYTLWVGVLAERTGAHDQAVAFYAQALALRPTWAASSFWPAQSVTLFDEALSRALVLAQPSSRGQLLFYAGDQEGGIALARQIAEGEDTALAWLTLGELLLHSDASIEAEAALTETLRRDDTLASAYALRAEAHLRLGDLSGAERDARIALFLDPLSNGVGGWYVLGMLAEEAGDLDAACAYYARSLPFEIRSQNWEVAVYRRIGNFFLLFDAPASTRYDVAAWQRQMSACPDS